MESYSEKVWENTNKNVIDLIHNSESFLIYLVGQAIKECVGANNCEVVFNLVPKVHAMSDIYCQLIPNEEESVPNYEIVPRIGAFEVSINGTVSCQIIIIKS